MTQFYKVLFIVLCVLVSLSAIFGPKTTANDYFISFDPPPKDTVHGLIGRYYNDAPGSDFDSMALQRIDSVIQFDWGDGSPAVGVIQENDFSVRWLGLILAPETGTYTFHTYTDDGARLYINGQKIIDYWGSCCADNAGSIDLVAGHLYPIVMEMQEGGGGASAKYLDWEVPGRERSLVHSNYLYAVVPQTVSRPAFDPKPRLFEGTAKVNFIIPTEGSVVHYTMDGTDPTPDSPIYEPEDPIVIDSSTMLKARAFANGKYPSVIISGYFKIIPPFAATPSFSPSEGVYKHPQFIRITSADEDATIYYTTDGSVPTSSSDRYVDPVEIDSTTRLKAIAIKEGRTDSKVASASYTIRPEAVATPVVNVEAGTYSGPQNVTLTSSTPDAIIHYAFNDNVLNEASSIYTAPIVIDQSTTLKAYAEKEGLAVSDIMVAAYVIGKEKDTAAAPQFSQPGGHYKGVLRLALFSETPDAAIYYTLDGSTPDADALDYFAPILIEDSLQVKAIATHGGMESSQVVSATYVIDGSVMDTSEISSDLPEAKLQILPNPATVNTRISWINLIYTKEGTVLTITDARGAMVRRVRIKGGYTYYDLNTSSFASGVYFIKVQSGDDIVLGKMIVNR